MDNSFFNLGIIRESRKDESRSPLAPKHIKELKKLFPNININIQSSPNRCFNDEEFIKEGGIIKENLQDSNLILGVKEIDKDILMNDKRYLFFSHTSKIQSNNSEASQGTPGMDKKDLLKTILKKNITLIDYENLRDKNDSRYLGFGRFAGIVGCYNSLSLYDNFLNKKKLPRAIQLNDYSLLKDTLKNNHFSKMKILITGDGRVAKGVLELLKFTNISQVSPKEFLKKNIDKPIFCNLKTSEYVASNSNSKFELKHFIKNPEKYFSITEEYLKITNLLISAHYWDPFSPKIFELSNLHKFKDLKVIGDITCDINGSIPTTLRSTTIENPYFYFNKDTYVEIKKSSSALAIMAVDNLPSELPRDSSEEFGNSVVKEVLPYIINKDDGRIHNATIVKNSKFLSKYSYLNNYIFN